jgi:hypothetical protein
MKSKNNTLNRGFLKAYDLLPAGIQSDVRNQIQKSCDWNADSTFYAKVKGTTPIKSPEWRVLEEIFQAHGIDVHSGKSLKSA